MIRIFRAAVAAAVSFAASQNAPDSHRMRLRQAMSSSSVSTAGAPTALMMQYDTAATLAEIFGLEIPQVWVGKSMSHVFEN